MEALGIYIHIPFCVRKCLYCDFLSMSADTGTKKDYMRALQAEITARGQAAGKAPVASIFFGGGTPTAVGSEEMIRTLECVRGAFDVRPGAEITFEANPKTIDRSGLKKLYEAGFNRVSFGVQSMVDQELETIGRLHNADEAEDALSEARKAGFDNINADLMFGLPGQTMESFACSLERTAAAGPTHISCYGLMLEEGTPLYERRTAFSFPDEDEERAMYEFASRFLTGKGFSHYEISNFALPGYECRHNLRYWKDGDYIGCGTGAASRIGGKYCKNITGINEYMRLSGDIRAITYNDAEFENSEKYSEFIMLRLRLAEGFSLEEFSKRFGFDFLRENQKKIKKYTDAGLMETEKGSLKLTLPGFYVSNTIISDLI